MFKKASIFFHHVSLLFVFLLTQNAGAVYPVLTVFGTGDYNSKSFSELHEQIKTDVPNALPINIKLGNGKFTEELKPSYQVLALLKESIEKNDVIKKFKPKQADSKKIKVALIASSLTALYARCMLQKYGADLPIEIYQFISICGPQAGLYHIPTDKPYQNSVEQECVKIQKYMTEQCLSYMMPGGLGGVNRKKPTSPIEKKEIPASKETSFFGSFFKKVTDYSTAVISYFNIDRSMAYQTLYSPHGQKTWGSAGVWNDPYHQEDYLTKNQFLPIFNCQNIKDEKSVKIWTENLNRTTYFHFMGVKDDTFIPHQTALLEEYQSGCDYFYTPAFASSNKKPENKYVSGLGKRLGLSKAAKEDRLTLDLFDEGGHECHTNPSIIEKTSTYVKMASQKLRIK